MPFYTDEQAAEVEKEIASVQGRADDLLLRYAGFHFGNARGQEYARQGFCRRVGTIKRCVKNIATIVPIRRADVPSRDELHDAQINLQAFIANVYGCTDNLAWIWVYETGLAATIDRRRVGLRPQNTQVRASFSAEFQTYLTGLDKWFDYLVDYRDALAHRVPLYIPPGNVLKKDVEEYTELQELMGDALAHPRHRRVRALGGAAGKAARVPTDDGALLQ